MVRMPAYRRVLLMLLSAAAFLGAIVPGHAQENTLTVVFEGETRRPSHIGAFRSRSVLYASLSDLTQLLDLDAAENSEIRRLEITHPPYRMTVTGGSPYISFVDDRDRRTIYQLPQNVLYAASSYFVPIESFARLIEPLLNRPARFDRAAGTLLIAGPPAASRFDIPGIRLEQKANGTLVRISAARPLPDYESWLRQDGWLYVTIADARADTGAINRVAPLGLVRDIVAIQSPTSLQLTFRLSGRVRVTELLQDESSNDLLLTIHSPGPSTQATLEKERKRWELDVIVIDAGHGGYDPGTIGVSGTREKDVTLGVALKLGKLIRKNLKDVKVVYTRQDDSFVELYRRGQIANEAGGKLFISIHCNAMPRKPHPTRGFEVYLLRPGKTQEALEIAERENAVIRLEEGYEDRYQELTEENFILVAMAQTTHLRSSEQFADLTQREMAKSTGLDSRGVKQAGFYVLVGAAMPNVLIETGYLSNKQEERFLRSDSGQQKIAESIHRAIARYKREYEKLLLEGKPLGLRN